MTQTAASQALDAALDRALEENRIVGAVLMMAENGQRIYTRAAGFSDREQAIPMQAGTWFRYASVTKSFTTVAALRLIDEGRLSPDDPVSKWLPEFTPEHADGTRADITVAHLLAHMAGLDYSFNQFADGLYAQAGVSDGISDRGISLAENLRRIASVPLDLTPGQHWRYSMATDVLGAVIEAVTGQALPFAMAELVTGPLALDAAFFLADARNLAVPYRDGPDGPLRMEGVTYHKADLPDGQAFGFDPERITDLSAYPSGGGGMAGTAEAALTLLETLRDGDFLSPTLRAEAAKNRMHEEHPMRGPGYGHAWAGAVLLDPALAQIGQSAGSLTWGGIYGHSWFIDPARRRTAILLTNTTTEGMGGQLSQDVRDAVAL